jgi:hypothetical protein
MCVDNSTSMRRKEGCGSSISTTEEALYVSRGVPQLSGV